MVGAGVVARLELGLRDGGLERHVPEAGGLGLVGLAAHEVAQEERLAHRAGAVVDGAVADVPVVRQAEQAERVLEEHLVLDRERLAQLVEVAPADAHLVGGLVGRAALVRGHEVGVVVQGRVAADAVVVLHPALGGQPVVVPADRVEHLEAGHPLVAGDAVGLGVAEDVTDVEGPAGGGRRRVDGPDLVPAPGERPLPVERVGPLFLPYLRPLLLQAVHGRPLGDLGCRRGTGGCGGGHGRGFSQTGTGGLQRVTAVTSPVMSRSVWSCPTSGDMTCDMTCDMTW